MMRGFRRTAAACLSVVSFLACAQSVDFRQAYAMALSADPTWAQARAQARADQEERALGRSGLLPTVQYRYNRGRNWTESRSSNLFGEVTQDYRYNSYSSGFTLTQPLFDAAAFAQYREGAARAEAAGFTLARARQALAVRVLQVYTDVLYAEEALGLAEAQARTLHEDARRSERYVAGGEGTVTDSLEIEARLGLVQAQEIEARDQLRDARNALRAVVGPDLGEAALAPLDARAMAQLAGSPQPLAQWRDTALNSNPELAAQRRLLEAARQRREAARAGHLPSVRLYARKQLTDSNAENQIGQRYDTNTVGVEISVPLYSGGRTSAASAQALAQQDVAQHKLEADTRAMLDDLERQYNLLASSERRIAAYQRAADAATGRLRATRRSVLGGERTNLDVLDAERQRVEALRDLARARYDNLLAWLTLRWQAGVLEESDVSAVGMLFLAPPSSVRAASRVSPRAGG
ncbi:Type I secretion outer membrane protein, TolC precursor [plant metagenome]|uniref:Type I secretion outer membrane protein, TolC n=2 Tax=plant metagenome TaxID=1297885 RepID=A0A484RGC2_9ZZZZ